MPDEELQSNPAETTAPEPEITATPGTVEPETPQTSEVEETEITPETTPEKVFTQEEMDAAIGKRLAKERRKWDREQSSRQQEIARPENISNEPLTPDQFETYEDYAEALAERKAIEIVQQREVQKQRSTIDDAYAERVEKAMEKYNDFDQVVQNPNLRITEVMAETIKASDIGPEVAYYLGSNPKEAERIAYLPPLQQAREIGKLEAKVASEPPVKKTTSAPAPITPVNARTSNNPSYDTTDPRAIKSMSTSEWIEAERQRQIRKMQSQNR